MSPYNITISMFWDSQALIKDISRRNIHYSDLDVSLIKKNKKYNIIDLEKTLTFSIKCGWVVLQDDLLILTNSGKDLASKIGNNKPSIFVAREQLSQYLAIDKPYWSFHLIKGRNESLPFLHDYVIDIFKQLQLMGDENAIDYRTISWWDKIAAKIYSNSEFERIKIGRTGEYLSYIYEKTRTGHEPEWTAINSNKAGFDLMSRKSDVNHERLCIEVKTCSSLPLRIFLTKNEWLVADTKDNSEYILHIWDITNAKDVKLYCINKSFISSSICNDIGFGDWVSIKISFADLLKSKMIKPNNISNLNLDVIQLLDDIKEVDQTITHCN